MNWVSEIFWISSRRYSEMNRRVLVYFMSRFLFTLVYPRPQNVIWMRRQLTTTSYRRAPFLCNITWRSSTCTLPTYPYFTVPIWLQCPRWLPAMHRRIRPSRSHDWGRHCSVVRRWERYEFSDILVLCDLWLSNFYDFSDHFIWQISLHMSAAALCGLHWSTSINLFPVLRSLPHLLTHAQTRVRSVEWGEDRSAPIR